MHACSTSLGNPPPYTSCLCLPYSAPLKIVQVSMMLQNQFLITVEGHRPGGNTTGQGKLVIDHWYGSQPKIFSWPTLNMVGRPYIPAESCFDSSRGQNRAWQCISSKCVHQHIPYHVYDSKGHGSRFSDHQSRISMHDGPRNQVCILIWNAMHIIKQRELDLYHTQLKR